jgi:hypothetical protein
MAARHGGLWVLSLATLAGLAPSASAQLLATEAPPGAVQVILSPLEGGEPGPLPLAPAGVPGWFDGGWHVDLGVEYLRPFWTHRTATLVIPARAAGGAAAVGATGNISQDFNFVPHALVEYEFPDLGLGVSASGQLLHLSGRLDRTINGTAAAATLSSQGNVDIAVANVVELTKTIPLDEFECLRDCFLGDGTIIATVGTRYSYVHQDLNVSLASGGAVSTLNANQQFSGFGLTASVSAFQPVGGRFFLYERARGSLLIGTNSRSSSLSAAVPGAADSSGVVVTEDRTVWAPAGEFEAGVAWVTGLNGRAAADPNAARLWIKAGAVAQIWGDLALLSAADAGRQFSDSSLFLFGFTLTAGIEY